MTIKIGDKEYCLDGYMTEVQKAIFDAYHQGLVDGIVRGRADAIYELMELLPNCDKVDIEHLICLIEKVKEQTDD